MRILVPVCVGLVVVSGIVSTVLWRELQKDEQLIGQLRTELTGAKTALASRPPPQVVAEAAPQPSSEVKGTSDAAPAASPPKITREQAAAVLTADAVKRQKALLADAEYRKALLAQARVDLKQHYAGLAVELGLSDREADAVLDLLAETQLKVMASITGLAEGRQPDAAASAEMERLMKDQGQKTKDALIALLGPERYKQFEEYDEIQPSRTRVNNLTNLLARSGQPLSNTQTRSLTTVMVAEQRRMEVEAKAIKDAGQTDKRSPADIQAETNRRILEQVPGFLNSQQLQLVRGRFEQRSTIDRAADRVQQREREVLQESPK